jgi:DNA-binding LacI/PurR family transcriptional regulator
LEKLDCDANSDFYAPCKYEETAIHNAVRKLMELSIQPSAILCSSDFYAIYVYRSLNLLGFKIPEDVSVMGYCNFPGGQVMRPPITTIDLGHVEAVKRAFDLLKNSKKWFGRKDVAIPEIIVKHKVIERGSTARRIECEIAQ